MKTLRTKLLLSLMASAALALLLVTLITRVELRRGFFEFIERQETRQLETLVPALTELYERSGSWGRLTSNPRLWRELSMSPQAGRGWQAHPPPHDGHPPPGRAVMHLRDRLFLLDKDRNRIAGARIHADKAVPMQAVQSGGETVGWVGFRPIREAQTPEALMFLAGQTRSTLISLALALVLAGILGFVLARHISRPLSRLKDTVGRLTDGDYAARATVETGDEVGLLAGGVNRLAGTLEKNETARRRWVADIAHELRTPIAILKGELEALVDGIRQADERTLISLQEEVAHLNGLVDDLQTLALADAGALKLNRQNLNFSTLVRQVGEMFRDRMAERKIRFQMDLPDSVSLNGDAQRLRQVLNNLLENSLRYTARGSDVSLVLSLEPGHALLVLEDSAPGVSGVQLDHLFDRFYRAEESRNRAAGGSGLGLAICRNIVEAHDGSISAEHSKLGGLAIRLTLPGSA